MKKQEFIEGLQEALEIEKIKLDENTNLIELDEYDSLSVMAIIAFVDNNFSKKLTGIELASITTVQSLLKLIGLENFSD
ncbi:MAG TPA: acyl carrier protein [Bacteroidales bacterium]|nr:acyl carrier protein [Bacteroidales bacterium]